MAQQAFQQRTAPLGMAFDFPHWALHPAVGRQFPFQHLGVDQHRSHGIGQLMYCVGAAAAAGVRGAWRFGVTLPAFAAGGGHRFAGVTIEKRNRNGNVASLLLRCFNVVRPASENLRVHLSRPLLARIANVLVKARLVPKFTCSQNRGFKPTYTATLESCWLVVLASVSKRNSMNA